MKTTSPLRSTIRILLIMERRMVREGLVYLLQADPEVRVVGAFAGPEEALDICRTVGADVVLLDVDDASTTNPAFIDGPREECGGVRVVAISSVLDAQVEERLHAQGSVGLALKTSPSAELLAMVKRAHRGEILALPVAGGSDVATVRQEPNGSRHEEERLLMAQLTPREREILQVISEGRSTADVASRLSISALTVQSHVKSILAKLGVHSKIEAVGFALRTGVVMVPSRRRPEGVRRAAGGGLASEAIEDLSS